MSNLVSIDFEQPMAHALGGGACSTRHAWARVPPEPSRARKRTASSDAAPKRRMRGFEAAATLVAPELRQAAELAWQALRSWWAGLGKH